MQKRPVRGHIGVALFVALLGGAGLVSQQAFAQTSSSPNYQMTESQFGNTSGVNTCSDSYCATVSIGDEGRSSSASTPEFGEIAYSEPMLEMIVSGGDSSLGNLTTETTGTKTMNIKVRNYLTGGYYLQIVGKSPTYGDHSLFAPPTPTESRPGTEQFGINAVVNTTPEVGANPVKQPSGESGVDLLTGNYNTANSYMYLNGETIAQSQQNTGGADFTVTMIVNISNATPAGQYSGDFAAVILPYF